MLVARNARKQQGMQALRHKAAGHCRHLGSRTCRHSGSRACRPAGCYAEAAEEVGVCGCQRRGLAHVLEYSTLNFTRNSMFEPHEEAKFELRTCLSHILATCSTTQSTRRHDLQHVLFEPQAEAMFGAEAMFEPHAV